MILDIALLHSGKGSTISRRYYWKYYDFTYFLWRFYLKWLVTQKINVIYEIHASWPFVSRSEASKESVSADKPSSAIVRENNNQLNKNKLQTEGSPEPDHEPEPGGQALQADHPAVEALKADQPDVQAPLADQPDGQPRTESPDPSERLEGQSVTDGQDTGDRSEGQQLKRKAADALSSEDESRKKMDLKVR